METSLIPFGIALVAGLLLSSKGPGIPGCVESEGPNHSHMLGVLRLSWCSSGLRGALYPHPRPLQSQNLPIRINTASEEVSNNFSLQHSLLHDAFDHARLHTPVPDAFAC